MTDTQKEMLKLYSKANENGKQIIFDILACSAVFGEPFYKELQEALDKGTKSELRTVVAKYIAILKERATA